LNADYPTSGSEFDIFASLWTLFENNSESEAFLSGLEFQQNTVAQRLK